MSIDFKKSIVVDMSQKLFGDILDLLELVKILDGSDQSFGRIK